jgi:homoserine kinase
VVLAGQLLETAGLDTARQTDVPELAKIRQASHALEIYGTVLAGAGPAIVTLVAPEKVNDLLDVLAYLELPGKFEVVDIANTGMSVN